MVTGLADVLKEKQIPIVIVLNCLNRLGHTDGWTALDYVTGLEQAMGRPATHIMYNSAQPNTEQLSQYAIDSHPELLIVDNFEDDSRVIRAPLIQATWYIKVAQTCSQHIVHSSVMTQQKLQR
jgi:2-phospho-L-lactate transferase/gluconeogenesis factor (CofD/UPF0052 family)